MTQCLLTHTPVERQRYYAEEAVARLARLGEVVCNPYDRHLTEEEMLALAPDAAVVVTEWATGAGEAYFARAHALKVLVRSGVEVLNVDLAAATRHGVIIANTPGLYTTAVAEMVVAFMVCLARGLISNHNALQGGNVPERTTGTELRGKTLGLAGLGDIGRRLAGVAACLGMQVLAYDPYVTKTPPGMQLVSLEQLLAESDFVSLHMKLTAETRGMFGAAQLQLMRPGSYLINTARGPVLDETAVVAALESGHLAGAAFDVYATEPDILASPLLRAPNVITTGHIGGFTRETMVAQAMATAETAELVLAGAVHDPRVHVLNPAVLQSLGLRVRTGWNRR